MPQYFSHQAGVLFVVTLFEIYLNFARWFSDSGLYAELAATGSTDAFYVRLRFMLPYLASPFWYILGQPAGYVGLSVIIALLNSAFWIGGVIVAYRLGSTLKNRTVGFFSALFFTTSVPVIAYGAAVLAESPAYFFVGLSLLLALKTNKTYGKLRGLVEGVTLAIGGFFHYAAFLGVLFAVVYRLKQRRRFLETILGSGLTLALVGFAAYFKEILNSEYQNVVIRFTPEQIVGARDLGPELLDALPWTFGIPSRGTLKLLIGFQPPAINFLWFALIAATGLWVIQRRVMLAAYLTTLSLYVVATPVFIERYLFVLWPCLIPIMVCGIAKISELPPVLERRVFSMKTKPVVTLLANPYFYVAIYFVVQAIVNNISVMHTLGPSRLLPSPFPPVDYPLSIWPHHSQPAVG